LQITRTAENATKGKWTQTLKGEKNGEKYGKSGDRKRGKCTRE